MICQNMSWQLPTLPTHLLRPCSSTTHCLLPAASNDIKRLSIKDKLVQNCDTKRWSIKDKLAQNSDTKRWHIKDNQVRSSDNEKIEYQR